jgi:hypothetical protein
MDGLLKVLREERCYWNGAERKATEGGGKGGLDEGPLFAGEANGIFG